MRMSQITEEQLNELERLLVRYERAKRDFDMGTGTYEEGAAFENARIALDRRLRDDAPYLIATIRQQRKALEQAILWSGHEMFNPIRHTEDAKDNPELAEYLLNRQALSGQKGWE